MSAHLTIYECTVVVGLRLCALSCGTLPSPRDAPSSFACTLAGFNAGIGYLALHGDDEVGLWQTPTEATGSLHPYKTAAYVELLITAFAITFFTVLISTPLLRKALKEGKTVPVEDAALRGGLWRCVPVRMLGTFTRAILLALWATATIGSIAIALLQATCALNGMHNQGAECSMSALVYIWLKATFAFFVAFAINPLLLLATVNVATLPPLELTFFVQNQKARWEKQERENAHKAADAASS
jgi:hypothetical protein